MQALRQLGGGVIIAIFAVILVLGGIFLSLAETLPTSATPTQIPPTFPQSFPTPTATVISIVTVTQTTVLQIPTETASPTASQIALQPAATSCTVPSGWIRIITTTGDTIYSLAQRYKTSTDSLNAANCLTSADLPAGFALYVPPVPTVTVIPCGPPLGWVKTYIVQPGDNLYRIALSYGLTFPQLQRGNCMGSSTTIYVGQRLWVPNIPTRTPVPGVTIVPTFPTEISPPTVTAVPPTNTELPTTTSVPTATLTPFPSQTPPQQ
ncbi:MAG TPA: LysM peptidoglycan-binding domain-containing protein [Anaerolineales bacterium]